MAFTPEQNTVIEATMAAFLEVKRPAPDIRLQVDLAWRIEKQSIIIYEDRLHWKDPSQRIHNDMAKATYVKSANKWKVYWLRSDGKWYSYTPAPEVENLRNFTQLVIEDEAGAFFG